MSGAGEWFMQTFEIPGSQLRELYVGAVWRRPDSPKDPNEPAKYSCGDQEFGEVFQYRDYGRRRTSFSRRPRDQLVGGLVDGAGKAQSLVWTDSRDLVFAQVKARRRDRPVNRSGAPRERQRDRLQPDRLLQALSLAGRRRCGPCRRAELTMRSARRVMQMRTAQGAQLL